MTLTVEDGTGVTGADSYVSLAYAETYISNYKTDTTAWDAAADAVKEVAARQASKWLDGRFCWRGLREEEDQGLDWPRTYAVDDDGYAIDDLPEAIKQATCELMYLVVGGTDITVNVDRSTRTKKEKVGPLEVEYMDGATPQPVYPVVSRLVSHLVVPGGKVMRA